MSNRRFKLIIKHMSHNTREHVLCFNGVSPTALWKVHPLVNSFNVQRKRNYTPGDKMVVDESTSYWRGKDQRRGSEGCPHVTKIPRKPKSVDMDLKNICCCDNSIMWTMEIMTPKDEMWSREHTGI